ncbi:desumoylating isopeptidase 1 [Benincasa hispida]|uniref:desumoylating isopeptidase 1 n=1 Tax=Benincasa hispida TaxID=102211 RepID=UPI001900E4E6|nr:desumoylating isopeptidase 1 [Benincasa hispida]XP_038887397.1 desumoylating isopeptidase 1 [Benincasa hispida]
MAEEESHRVVLNLYDLSCGLARQFSKPLLGKPIEGIWHTGIVVYDNEYYFGGGIYHSHSGNTPFGTPIGVIDLGITHIPKDVFESYLIEISPRYTAETYSLLGHNCNNFSNEVAQFLVGSTIPEYILQLPNEVRSSPIGRLMLPMIQNLETTLKSGAVPKAPQVRHSQPAMTSAPISVLDSNIEESAGGAVGQSGGGGSKATQSAEQNTTIELTHLSTELAVGAGHPKSPGKTIDESLLRDARAMIRDRIKCEFVSIMATGKYRASEAAALAAKRVMSKYNSHTSVAASQD